MFGICITKKGLKLLANLAEFGSGNTLVLTRIMVGSGKVPAETNPMDLEDLIAPVAQATTTKPVSADKTVTFAIEYRSDMNGGLDHDFMLNEYGVFAQDPDDGEILLYYANLGDYPEPVWAYQENGPICAKRYPVSINVFSDVGVDPGYRAAAYMTPEDVRRLLEGNILPEYLGKAEARAKELIQENNPTQLEEVKKLIAQHNEDPKAHPELDHGPGGDLSGVKVVPFITLPVSGWKETGEEEWPWRLRLECDEAAAELVPTVVLDPESMEMATDAGLCAAVRSYSGELVFLSKRVPSGDLTGSLTLYSPGSKALRVDVSIPVDGWTPVDEEDEGIGDVYAVRVDVPLEVVTEAMAPVLAVLPECQMDAIACGLCPTCRTSDGALRLYAHTAPAKALLASLTLLKVPE